MDYTNIGPWPPSRPAWVLGVMKPERFEIVGAGGSIIAVFPRDVAIAMAKDILREHAATGR